MTVYVRRDSPFYWALLERPHAPPIKESTKIPRNPPPAQRRENRQLAEAYYHARMAELARAGADIPTKRPPITFTAFSSWYLANVSAHKRGHLRERERILTLRETFGPLLLTAITKATVQEWMTLRRNTVKASTVNRELDVIKHVLVAAVPTYLTVSPIARLKRLYAEKQDMRTLSPADEAKILAELPPADQAIIIMALDTLMRAGDIVNLQRAQDHGTYLTVLNPKGGESYKVPVSRRLRVALDAVPGKEPYYFAHRRVAKKARDWPNSFKQMLEDACTRAKVAYGRNHGGITFHMLRHTGASRMVEAGVDLRTVQEIGGWKNLRQLSRYAHPSDAAKQRAVEAVSGSFSIP